MLLTLEIDAPSIRTVGLCAFLLVEADRGPCVLVTIRVRLGSGWRMQPLSGGDIPHGVRSATHSSLIDAAGNYLPALTVCKLVPFAYPVPDSASFLVLCHFLKRRIMLGRLALSLSLTQSIHFALSFHFDLAHTSSSPPWPSA